MMPNCDPRDRFVDQYLKLMIDSFSCTPMGADACFLAHLSQRLIDELIVYPCSGVRRRCPPFSNVFSSETAWPIQAKFYVEPPWEGGTKVYINGPGHMTKMAAMPIYGKNLKKIFFSRTGGPISTKLGM